MKKIVHYSFIICIFCGSSSWYVQALLKKTKWHENKREKHGRTKQEVCHGWLQIEQTCYKYIAEPGSYHYAKQYCENHGAFLVTIHNQTEEILVLNLTRNHDVWLGLTNTGSSTFKWLDSKPIVYTNWLIYRPRGEKCVQLISGGQWADCSCHYKIPFVCKKHMKLPDFVTERFHLISVIVIPSFLVCLLFLATGCLLYKSCYELKLAETRVTNLKKFDSAFKNRVKFLAHMNTPIQTNEKDRTESTTSSTINQTVGIVTNKTLIRNWSVSSKSISEDDLTLSGNTKSETDRVKTLKSVKTVSPKNRVNGVGSRASVPNAYDNIYYIHDEKRRRSKTCPVTAPDNVLEDSEGGIRNILRSDTIRNAFQYISDPEFEASYKTEITEDFVHVTIL